MKITKINLLNFRNYDKLELFLNEKMNIFIGNNAQGKTNILEAMVILALTKSHRVGTDFHFISFGKEKAKIKGKIKNGKFVKELEIILESSGKKLFINKTPIQRNSDYISNLNIISFTPDDLEIIKSSPSIRRNVLNIQLSQLSKKYLNTYNEYNKLLKMRNEYLKMLFTNSIADRNYLDIITNQLIEKAIFIYQERKKYMDSVNEKISLIYEDIGEEKGLSIEYLPNILISDYEDEQIKSVLLTTYQENYKKELNYGMTLFGPHRDDFAFFLNGKDLKNFGSQGQQKLAVICYKLSEIPLFTEVCGTEPVLLFDDIFSELDIKKRNKLLGYVNHDIQSIITTTDLKNIQKKYLEEASIFEVRNGKIIGK